MMIENPFLDNDQAFSCEKRDEAYVELAILTAQEVDHIWKNDDREYQINQMNCKRSSIDMNEIINDNNKFTTTNKM